MNIIKTENTAGRDFNELTENVNQLMRRNLITKESFVDIKYYSFKDLSGQNQLQGATIIWE